DDTNSRRFGIVLLGCLYQKRDNIRNIGSIKANLVDMDFPKPVSGRLTGGGTGAGGEGQGEEKGQASVVHRYRLSWFREKYSQKEERYSCPPPRKNVSSKNKKWEKCKNVKNVSARVF